MQSKAVEVTCLTRVAQDAKRCMTLGAIKGNRLHPFDSGSAGCQALHGMVHIGVLRSVVNVFVYDCISSSFQESNFSV